MKFLRDPTGFGFPITRSRFGYFCVEGMQFGAPVDEVDPTTGEVTTPTRPVLPLQMPPIRAQPPGRKPRCLGLPGRA